MMYYVCRQKVADIVLSFLKHASVPLSLACLQVFALGHVLHHTTDTDDASTAVPTLGARLEFAYGENGGVKVIVCPTANTGDNEQ